MASSARDQPVPPRMLRMLLCGHIGGHCEDFPYQLGPCCDEWFRQDIQIEITQASSASQLLHATNNLSHDFVVLMFNPCIHACSVAQIEQTLPPGDPLREDQLTQAHRLPRGCDFIRLVRQRTLKPIFVIQNGALLRKSSRQEVADAGADLILSMPFSQEEFENGLRRFLHGSVFRRPTAARWPSATTKQPLLLEAPDAQKRFTVVSAIHAPAIQHTLAMCVCDIEVLENRRSWVDVGTGSVEALLNEPALADAGLVVLQLNSLKYPQDYEDDDRSVWLINELRVRTAGFILTLDSHRQTSEEHFETDVSGADLALPVPFDIEEAFAAVKSAHAIWASGR